MDIKFVLLAIGAYLLGSVPAGYLAVKWSRGTDIRKVGTGKMGAANVLNAGPKWLSIPVAVFDIGKGVLVVLIAKLMHLEPVYQVIVGLFAVVGHDWSIYLKFKSGGRGVFVTLGVITMISWRMGLIAFIGPYLLFAPFKQLAFTCGFAALGGLGLLVRIIGRRTELSKNVPLSKVIFYRLLFDRDIADRKLWNSRAITNQG